MQTINLKKFYWLIYTKDTFIEVPDEVAEALIESQREGRREDGRKHYYGVYSLDASEGIELHTMFPSPSPEEVLLQEEKQFAEELLLNHLEDALSQLTPTQVRRLYARFALKKKFREIAADEGVTGSCANDSVSRAIKKLRRIFQQNDWKMEG